MYARPRCQDRSRLIPTNGRDEVSQSLEMLPGKIALTLPVDPRQMDGTFPFDLTNHLRDRIFWRNRNQQMYRVRHQMSLIDSALALPGQLVKDLSQMRPQLPVEDTAATFRNEHNVIFALPLGVT